MKSISVRLAVIIASVLLCLVLIIGFWLERQLHQSIQEEGLEQAEMHARTLMGSLKTLMINGSGTLVREWLDRLDGVAGIEEVAIYRLDGSEAFTDLKTVEAVNGFLGDRVFRREEVGMQGAGHPSLAQLSQALRDGTVYDLSRNDRISLMMPIPTDVECLACHGYDDNVSRGILNLSLSSAVMAERIAAMRTKLWLGAGLLLLVLTAVLWISLRISVLQPIESLRNAIMRVGRGDRTALLPVVRQDELGELAMVFNQMQAALHVSESRNRAVMDNVVDGIITFNQDGTIESTNSAIESIFGYEKDELYGCGVSLLTPENHPDGEEAAPGNLLDIARHGMLGSAREISGRRKNGTVFPMDVAVSEMQVDNERCFIGIMRDITSRKARTAALRYQALHDALTDLPNRTLLMDRVQQALRTAHRDQHSMALLLMDLDRFKEVNDTLGHHVGDKLLQQVAQRLRQVLRESDTVARLGGDEFSVLLPSADIAQALVIVRKIIHCVEKPIFLEGQSLSVGASVGIAVYPQHGDNPSQLMQRADVAMYVAKRGSGGYAVYDPLQDQHSLRQLVIVGELRTAIECEQLVLHYQPKVELAEHGVSGLEALVRWAHPNHGLLAPDEFVPLAERTGLIKPLTLWVLRRVMQDMASLGEQGQERMISLNLSMNNLLDPHFPEEVAAIVVENPDAAEHIKLEITETGLMSDPQKAIGALEALADMGFHLAIDDFGTGYSSLSYLKQLPVDELKIDKSFGVTLTRDSNSAVIVRSTIDMAHELGLDVVAEGVETSEAYRLLEQLGCDSVQGYFVARPMSLSDMREWLAQCAWRGDEDADFKGDEQALA